MTFYGILIILCMVWWDYAFIETRVIDVANSCNEHWENEIKLSCPALLESGYSYGEMLGTMNGGNISLDLGGVLE